MKDIQEELAELYVKAKAAFFKEPLEKAVTDGLEAIETYYQALLYHREAVGESISQCRKALEVISAYKDAQGELSPKGAKDCAYCLSKLAEICAMTWTDHVEAVLRAELCGIEDWITVAPAVALERCRDFPAYEQKVRDSLRYLDADR